MKILVKVEKLKRLLIELLIKLGLKENDAETIIDCYIEADLCGVSTHGVSILPAHIEKIINNSYNINPHIEVEKEGICFSVINGDNAIGPISACYGMNLAIREAKEKGAYFVFSRNNNTLGPAFYYNGLALKEGMIGITITNSPAAMAPTNGKTKLFGTNPIAISIPAKNEKPIVLDMATSTVAKSKIKQALNENKKIPFDWATDASGNPTDDPEKAINGLLLPMSGYKGYGLSMMVDILSGLLSGAEFLNGVGKFYGNNECMDIGQTFIALNPKEIYGENFYEEIDEYIKTVKRSEKIGENEIIIPGENRINKKIDSLQNGIELKKQLVIKLEEILEQYGIKEKII